MDILHRFLLEFVIFFLISFFYYLITTRFIYTKDNDHLSTHKNVKKMISIDILQLNKDTTLIFHLLFPDSKKISEKRDMSTLIPSITCSYEFNNHEQELAIQKLLSEKGIHTVLDTDEVLDHSTVPGDIVFDYIDGTEDYRDENGEKYEAGWYYYSDFSDPRTMWGPFESEKKALQEATEYFYEEMNRDDQE